MKKGYRELLDEANAEIEVVSPEEAAGLLEDEGTIFVGREAQRRPRRIEGEALAVATGWLERYREVWEGNFQRLDTLLEELKANEAKRGDKKRKGDKK